VSWQCPVTEASWVYLNTTGLVKEYSFNVCAYCLYNVAVRAVNGAGMGQERIVEAVLANASGRYCNLLFRLRCLVVGYSRKILY
jgi:hypothetical protein